MKWNIGSQERDDEIKGNGNSYDFGARMHDPRIGRWFSVDKVVKSHLSPYQFAKNNGIIYIDSDGNDEIWFVITSSVVKGERQYTVSYEFIDDKNAEVTFRVVFGDAAPLGASPEAILPYVDGNPNIVKIKPFHGGYIPNQGSRIAQYKKLPLAFEAGVGMALDDYLAKLINSSQGLTTFLTEVTEADPNLIKALDGATKMGQSIQVAEAASYLEGAVGLFALGRKLILKSLIKDGTKELAEVEIKSWRLITNKLPNSTGGKIQGRFSSGKWAMEGNAKLQGQFDYIISAEGELVIGSKHTTLSGGGSVRAAGTLKIRNGKIVAFDNASGHYFPTPEEAARFREIFEDIGLDMSKAKQITYLEGGKKIQH